MVRTAGFTRRSVVACALLFLLLTQVHSSESSVPTDAAVAAVEASLTVEQTLLEQDRGSWRQLMTKRSTVSNRWSRLHEAIDIAVFDDGPGAAAELEILLAQWQQAEGERAELLAAERTLVARIQDRMRRIALFEERIVILQGRERPEEGLLTGSWEVVLLPTDQRGTFRLRQSGAVLSGTYRLTGGFTGSLEGTLVQTKVYLERIDSRLGRSMEFEGRLSSDRNRILGTWQSYELAEGDRSNGHWSARRLGPGEAEPDGD